LPVLPGGWVSFKVKGERGSKIEVGNAENRAKWRRFTATGGWQTFRMRKPDNVYLLYAEASDQSGNTSQSRTLATVTSDSRRPFLRGLGISPASPADTATWITFASETGSTYWIRADGRLTRGAAADENRVRLSLPNGRHAVRVTLRDDVGNTTRKTVIANVAVAALKINAKAPDPNSPTPTLAVEGSPYAHGVLTLAGEKRVRFNVDGQGVAQVPLELDDGIYSGTVKLTDAHGRSGVAKIKNLALDRSAPLLRVTPAMGQAEPGTYVLLVSAEAGARVAVGGDGTSYVSDGATRTMTIAAGPGAQTINVIAIDAAGNQSATATEVLVRGNPTWIAWAIAAGVGAVAVCSLALRRKRSWPTTRG